MSNLIDLSPAVTPAALMLALTDKMAEDWRILSVFSPGLDYEEALESLKSRDIAEDDARDLDALDSVFAMSRSTIEMSEEIGYAGELDRLCGDRLAATIPGKFTLSFRAFFSDMQTLEAFEIGYLAGNILRCLTSIDVSRDDLPDDVEPQVESFYLTWNPISSIDWSLSPNNFMALDFNVKIEGTFRSPYPDGAIIARPDLLTIHFNSFIDN